MITKQKLGERVQRILSGGSSKPELKIDIRDAMLAVSQARDQLIMQYYYDTKKIDQHSIPYDIISTFKEPVNKDGSKLYVKLPLRGLSGLSLNNGIYRLTNDCDEEIIPTRTGFKSLYSEQEGRRLDGRPTYYPKLDKCYLSGVDESCEITIEMIVAGEEFDEDEFFCIPADLQEAVVMQAIKVLSTQRQIPEDQITNAKGDF